MRIEVKIQTVHTDISHLEKIFPEGWKQKLEEIAKNLPREYKGKKVGRAVINYTISRIKREWVIDFWNREEYLGYYEYID